MADNQTELLSAAARAEIDREIAKYPAERRESAVMAALRIAQDASGGWLSEPVMDAVAAHIEMPRIAVYEVATFYSMYELKPVGRHKICVCTNISCQLRGSDEVVAHLRERLGIGLGQTTADGRVTLKEVECLGACAAAPVAQVGHRYHENLTPEALDALLDGME
ncbi:MAG TPA: NADH-quinone oxidoreductase subunit NuoE [Gammaproteobacteria bacterium]